MRLCRWRLTFALGVERLPTKSEQQQLVENARRGVDEARRLHEQTARLLDDYRKRDGDPQAFTRLMAGVDLDAPLGNDEEEGAEHGS